MIATEGGGYLKEVERPTTLKRVLQFEVPRDRVEHEIEGIIAGIRREVSMPGFRKGKAPLDLVRARFAETAEKEAIEKLIPEAYQKALRTESLRPVLPAEISNMRFGSEGPLVFQIAIEVHPEVEIKRYKGIKAHKSTKPVEEADIDREVEALRGRVARFEKLEREAGVHDIVVMDYWRVGADGKQIRGSRVTNYPAEIGAGGLVKQFNDSLMGVKKGDKKTITVTYPEDFVQEELRGRSVTFGVEVKDIGRMVLPEVNEDFAKMMGLDSVEAVRAKLKENLEAVYEEEALRKTKQDILNTIVQESSFEVPDGLVQMGLESLMKPYREQQEKVGDSETAEKLGQMKERLRPIAVNAVKEHFIVVDIARRENIAVGDDEIEEVLKSIADRAGISVDEARQQAARSEEIDRWRRDMLKDKVLDFLLGHADVKT